MNSNLKYALSLASYALMGSGFVESVNARQPELAVTFALAAATGAIAGIPRKPSPEPAPSASEMLRQIDDDYNKKHLNAFIDSISQP